MLNNPGRDQKQKRLVAKQLCKQFKQSMLSKKTFGVFSSKTQSILFPSFQTFYFFILSKYDQVLIPDVSNIHVCCLKKPLVLDFCNIMDYDGFDQLVDTPLNKQSRFTDFVLSYDVKITGLNIGNYNN